MTWSRQPLAQYAAGYDAVIEFTALVINQVLTQQAVIALPVATAGPYSVPSPLPPPSGSGTGVASIAGPPAVSVMVDLAPSDQSLLRLLATSAQTWEKSGM